MFCSPVELCVLRWNALEDGIMLEKILIHANKTVCSNLSSRQLHKRCWTMLWLIIRFWFMMYWVYKLYCCHRQSLCRETGNAFLKVQWNRKLWLLMNIIESDVSLNVYFNFYYVQLVESLPCFAYRCFNLTGLISACFFIVLVSIFILCIACIKKENM